MADPPFAAEVEVFAVPFAFPIPVVLTIPIPLFKVQCSAIDRMPEVSAVSRGVREKFEIFF
jgi:hypothetical protein